MGRVLILGGGFGGVSTAVQLRRVAPEHEVVLVDRGTHFLMGFRKNDELVGRAPMSDSRRPLAALAEKGVDVVQGSITKVDPGARAAEVDGRTYEADAVVVALGAETVPEAVPGLAEHGLNAYDEAVVPRAAEALRSLESGRVAVGIFGAPYTCPPAPYELALLAKEASEARGARLEFVTFTPQPMSLPVLGSAGCSIVEARLALNGIEFRAKAATERVEADRVVLSDGDEIGFDLLLAIPPHRPPALLVDAGLAEQGGWVKVDGATLETGVDGVWAVGDCTAIPLASGQPMPKAGVLAANEGRVVADRIASRLAGEEPTAEFDGEGACFLEAGGGQAMMVRGRFLAEGGPQVELEGPSEELLAEKSRFERETLDDWFLLG